DHRMWFRKSCFCRQNVESNVWGSYRVSRLLRKRTRNLVERVAREAASGQAPQQCGSRTLAFKQRTNANDLRLQSGYGVGGRRGRDQAPSQIGPYRSIAVAASREQLGATHRQPGVVDEPGATQGCDRAFTRGGRMSRSWQPSLESLSRPVARGQRPSGRGERPRPPDLPPQRPCSVPVQLPPDCEPRAHDDIRGQYTPRPPVELDGHTAALPLA